MIEKAIIACENSGHHMFNDFVDMCMDLAERVDKSNEKNYN